MRESLLGMNFLLSASPDHFKESARPTNETKMPPGGAPLDFEIGISLRRIVGPSFAAGVKWLTSKGCWHAFLTLFVRAPPLCHLVVAAHMMWPSRVAKVT